jgi:effector-binding domain-containing protein
VSDDPGYLIGQMRVQTMREETFFHVTGRPVPMSGLDDELDRLIPLLEAAQAEAGIAQVGPVVVRYFLSGGADTYVMELGVPVRPGTPAAGEALVKVLPSYRCASLLYWGSLEHIGPAYEALIGAIRDAGLEQTGEGREWHYHFEGDGSPNNVIGLQLGTQASEVGNLRFHETSGSVDTEHRRMTWNRS